MIDLFQNAAFTHLFQNGFLDVVLEGGEENPRVITGDMLTLETNLCFMTVTGGRTATPN